MTPVRMKTPGPSRGRAGRSSDVASVGRYHSASFFATSSFTALGFALPPVAFMT